MDTINTDILNYILHQQTTGNTILFSNKSKDLSIEENASIGKIEELVDIIVDLKSSTTELYFEVYDTNIGETLRFDYYKSN